VRTVLTAGAPFGYEEGNGVNITFAFVYFPAYVVAELGADVAAYNAVVLSGLVLSGVAMYWLVRRLGGHPLVGAWAGLVFVVFPWHLEKAQGHAPFTHLEGFPLLVLAALAWRKRPTPAMGLLLIASAAILWTTAGYFGVLALVALGVLVPLAALGHRTLGTAQALRAAAFVTGGILAVVAAVYGVASLGSTEGGVATTRGVGELNTYGARPWEFVLPSYRSRFFGDEVQDWLVAHLHGSNFSETSLYVGWVTILLAGGWLGWVVFRRERIDRELRFATTAFGAIVAAGLAFSLPSPLPGTDIPAPSRLIWEFAPQFRVPSRFIALVMTGLVPLGALALQGLRSAIVSRARPGRLGTAAATALCLLAAIASFIELSISPPAVTTDLGTPPAEYAAVRKAPDGVLAEYPLASAEHGITSNYLFWQRAHGRRLVNGAWPGSFAEAVRQTLVDPVTPGTASALAALGVSVIVVRPNTYSFTGSSHVPPADLGDGYRLLERTSSGVSVWKVTAKPAPAIAAFTSGFGPPETSRGQPTQRWMTERTATIDFYAEHGGTFLARFQVGSYARDRVLDIEGYGGTRSFLVNAPRLVSIAVRVPAGRSSVTVTASPDPEPIPDGRTVSLYFSNWTFNRLSRAYGAVTPITAIAHTDAR
jgi:hypothetical protein